MTKRAEGDNYQQQNKKSKREADKNYFNYTVKKKYFGIDEIYFMY